MPAGLSCLKIKLKIILEHQRKGDLEPRLHAPSVDPLLPGVVQPAPDRSDGIGGDAQGERDIAVGGGGAIVRRLLPEGA